MYTWIALEGKPVVVVGSFSNQYLKDKGLVYVLKIVPMVMNVQTTRWNAATPQYVDVFVNSKYKVNISSKSLLVAIKVSVLPTLIEILN